MAAILLDGEAVAARIRSEAADRAASLAAEGVHVGLGTILVGDDAPSARYVALKHEDCAALGLHSVGEHLPATATQQEVLDAIARFNADPKVSAFLVQLPLPGGLDEEQALLAVDPDKDVDGLHPLNLGRLVLGTPGSGSCTRKALTFGSALKRAMASSTSCCAAVAGRCSPTEWRPSAAQSSCLRAT